MREQIPVLLNSLLDLVYPPVCLLCRRRLEAGAVCPDCQRDVKPILPPFCDRCGVPIYAEKIVCERCAAGPEPPFEWSQAAGEYSGTLRRAIHLLKYDGKLALAEPLGLLLARSLEAPTPLREQRPDRPAFDCIVPVPLHPSRQRERGFNQAEQLARAVAHEYHWPLDTKGLKRIRRTISQTKMADSARRAANLQAAFAAATPLYFDGKSVLLIDDVITTSATVTECARVLKNAGAKRVGVLALARAIP